jgi:hypothetical protein
MGCEPPGSRGNPLLAPTFLFFVFELFNYLILIIILILYNLQFIIYIYIFIFY